MMLLEVLAEEGEHPLPCVGGGLLVLAESGDTCQCVEGSTVGEAVPRMGVGFHVVRNVLLGQHFCKSLSAASVEHIALPEAGDDGASAVDDFGVFTL